MSYKELWEDSLVFVFICSAIFQRFMINNRCLPGYKCTSTLNTALEDRLGACVLGMPGPCEHRMRKCAEVNSGHQPYGWR